MVFASVMMRQILGECGIKKNGWIILSTDDLNMTYNGDFDKIVGWTVIGH